MKIKNIKKLLFFTTLLKINLIFMMEQQQQQQDLKIQQDNNQKIIQEAEKEITRLEKINNTINNQKYKPVNLFNRSSKKILENNLNTINDYQLMIDAIKYNYDSFSPITKTLYNIYNNLILNKNFDLDSNKNLVDPLKNIIISIIKNENKYCLLLTPLDVLLLKIIINYNGENNKLELKEILSGDKKSKENLSENKKSYEENMLIIKKNLYESLNKFKKGVDSLKIGFFENFKIKSKKLYNNTKNYYNKNKNYIKAGAAAAIAGATAYAGSAALNKYGKEGLVKNFGGKFYKGVNKGASFVGNKTVDGFSHIGNKAVDFGKGLGKWRKRKFIKKIGIN